MYFRNISTFGFCKINFIKIMGYKKTIGECLEM